MCSRGKNIKSYELMRTSKTKKDYDLIHLNQGELTIKDSSSKGMGSISADLTFTGDEIYP